MAKLYFSIRRPRGPHPKEIFPTFALEQDNWNDYSFQTLYHLSYYHMDSSGRVEQNLIGQVKILKQGQTTQDSLLLTSDFEQLEQTFCSVGQSLDYYERLSALGEGLKNQVLTALRDVVQTPAIADQFKDEKGWSTSLFRDHKDIGVGFMLLARGLITGDYSKVPNEIMRFSFEVPEWRSLVDFKFNAPDSSEWGFGNSIALPERIAVLVGRNGSGKSTLLARLSRVAFGNLDERSRPPLSDLGILEPPGIGFPRIITVAFSPFDSFKLPGSDSRNRKQVIKELERGEGRFSFIGLRDLAAEWTSRGTTEKNSAGEDDSLLGDRLGKTRLKSIQQLTDEFALFLEKIRSQGRQQMLYDVAPDLFSESAFQAPQPLEITLEEAKARFLACSTGHKIALLIVTGLLANIQPYSLVLVDEPETHLHPPLLALSTPI